MTPEDEEFLTALHQALDQRELQPDDPRYVSVTEHPEAFGPDVILELTRLVARSPAGTMAFLTGTRGSGKSTQLQRLKAELTGRGFAVINVNLEDYLNLRRPLDVVEFLYGMVGAISDGVADSGWIPVEDAMEIGWGRLAKWWLEIINRVDVKPTADVGAGIDLPGLLSAKINLKAELRKDESFVALMQEYLGGRVSQLSEQANDIVQDVTARLRSAWEGQGRKWSGLVVLFDSLDHVRGTDFAEVRRALQTLFDQHGSTIRLASARMVFVVPQWLHLEGGVRRVVNVQIASRDRQAYLPGVAALVEIVRRRVPESDLGRLFENSQQLESLAAASGGHLRDLLHLMLDASSGADELPFTDAALERAMQLGTSRLTPIADDERECLRYVEQTHAVPLHHQDEWESLAGLFDRHLILGFMDGEYWFDTHPLIRGELQRAPLRP